MGSGSLLSPTKKDGRPAAPFYRLAKLSKSAERYRVFPMPRFEYKTEILTSFVGRNKMRLEDFDAALKKHDDDGWEFVSVNLNADLKGVRDGHLLVFKRPRKE